MSLIFYSKKRSPTNLNTRYGLNYLTECKHTNALVYCFYYLYTFLAKQQTPHTWYYIARDYLHLHPNRHAQQTSTKKEVRFVCFECYLLILLQYCCVCFKVYVCKCAITKQSTACDQSGLTSGLTPRVTKSHFKCFAFRYILLCFAYNDVTF